MRDLIRTTQINKECPTCKGEGYVPAEHGSAKVDRIEFINLKASELPRYEICPKCKNNKT
jgi:hypothetical protein